jgi:prepilin peptidase CpaA
MATPWVAVLLVPVLILAAAQDVRTRRIPNRLVIVGAAAAVAAHVLAGGGPGALTSALGAAVGLAITLPFFAVRALGAGDVKLMAVVGAFVGPVQVLGAALLTMLAGGVLSLAAAVLSGSLRQVSRNLHLMLMAAVAGKTGRPATAGIGTTGRLPYAVAIAVGTCLQLWLAARGGWFFG